MYEIDLIVDGCAPLATLGNGTITYSHPPMPNGEYSGDTVADFSCNDEYQIQGSESSHCIICPSCGEPGNWSRQATCREGNEIISPVM